MKALAFGCQKYYLFMNTYLKRMSGNSFLSNEKFIKKSALLMTTAVLPILCCASIVLTFSFTRGSTTGIDVSH